jgi:hypothetical protein
MEDKIIKVIKQVSAVLADHLDERTKDFAVRYARSGNGTESYNLAFEDVQKVRASNVLQDPEIWELIFAELRTKENLSKWEIDIMQEYDQITETFDMSPFDLYAIYVHKGKNKENCISVSLNIDCIQSYQVLLYLYRFFKLLQRKIFYKTTLKRLQDESNVIKALGREKEKDAMLRSLSKIIDMDDMP